MQSNTDTAFIEEESTLTRRYLIAAEQNLWLTATRKSMRSNTGETSFHNTVLISQGHEHAQEILRVESTSASGLDSLSVRAAIMKMQDHQNLAPLLLMRVNSQQFTVFPES